MIIRFDPESETLEWGDLNIIAATNIVRNEDNRWRKKDQVVRTMGKQSVPYMPRKFPTGIWEVYRPQPRTDRYKAPYYIPTNATRRVFVWEVDKNGYVRETEQVVVDEEYGMHHSKDSTTTLGCISIVKENECLMLVEELNKVFDAGEKVYLEVM